MSQSLEDLRDILNAKPSASKRKRLGQCFTGMATSRLLAAVSFQSHHSRILDPMAGHGDLLEACAERAPHIAGNVRLFGVEIDTEIAHLGAMRMSACEEAYGIPPPHYIAADAFSIDTWLKFHPPFDLVITNPPYVRYQTLAKTTPENGALLLDASSTREALHENARHLAAESEYDMWRELILSYSGLSDMSVPSWLLCGLLTKAGGTLAIVVPQTWLNRDYAKLVRYYLLRFFIPLVVIHESGQRLFRDVQVPVSLIVARRLSPNEVLVPLSLRSNKSTTVTHIELSHHAALDESHVGTAFPVRDPEGAFADWLMCRRPRSKLGIKKRTVLLQLQQNEILITCSKQKWFPRLEGKRGVASVKRMNSLSLLPSVVTASVPARFLSFTQPLFETPINVGQGLRTGCNVFFYVDEILGKRNRRLAYVRTSKLFGQEEMTVPKSVLIPVLRRQSELKAARVDTEQLTGRVLNLRGIYLLEDNWLPELQSTLFQNDTVRGRYASKQLADYIQKAASTLVGHAATARLIPHLSAVRTNEESVDSRRLHGTGQRADAPRRWYMLPNFMPRHLPQLLIPRVVHERPCAFLNSEKPVLVDANFSTLWSEDSQWNPSAIFALLNSTWVELCLEALASPMGGGALKIEATHIRRIPLPKLDKSSLEHLGKFGGELESRNPDSWPHTEELQRIDDVVIRCLSGRVLTLKESQSLQNRLKRLVNQLRDKRRGLRDK